jgi:hypothetical protein
MNKIQMVDLKGQYLKIKTEIDAAIASVVASTAFINGLRSRHFNRIWRPTGLQARDTLCQRDGRPAGGHDGTGP